MCGRALHPGRTLRKILPEGPELKQQIQRFAMLSAMKSTQLAACNRLHDVEGRLARWLVICHDRIGGETMPFDSEILGADALELAGRA